MKILFSFAILFFSVTSYAFNRVVSYTTYKTYTQAEFKDLLKKKHVPKVGVPSKYTVDIYDVIYYTKWHDGSTIKASGLYFVPRNVKHGAAQLIYHHGTRMSKGRHAELGGEEFFCLAMAMDGYNVLLPDYIGLGHGDKFHLYQHAESMGQASVDMYFAAQELNDSLKVKTNNLLFLSGYSEGGYGTLATQKMIQEKYADKIHVTASSPMSGAYDMSGCEAMLMFKKYAEPHYLPFLLGSYNEVYNLVGPDVNVVYKAPYDTLIPRPMDPKRNLDNVVHLLPAVPADILKDSFVNMYVRDTNYPLRRVIKENSLCDWKPEAPVQLCYCDSDEQVTSENSHVAYEHMRSLGAKHVTLRRAAKNFSHRHCALIAMLDSKMYFDTFRHGSKYGRKGSPGKQLMASIARKLLAKKDEDRKAKRQKSVAGR